MSRKGNSRRRAAVSTIAVLTLVTNFLSDAHAERIRLSLPVSCTLGSDCFLQNYVDVVPGKGVGDYACGRATYDGHKGTDFRVRSAKAARKKVSVLASAPGRVRAVRDGVADRLMTDKNDPRIKGRECGNGVVIDHADGWQTQYCHLMRGSVVVAKGDAVTRGARLGSVGYSGAAEFAHLHITVRHNGKVVDPFLAQPVGTAACVRDAPGQITGLWEPSSATKDLGYKHGQLIEHGFAGGPLKSKDLEQDGAPSLSAISPALVAYVRFINLKKGDLIRLDLTGPGNLKVQNKMEPLDRSKAQYVAYVGKKRRAENWPAGQYKSTARLVRDGKVVFSQTTDIRLPQN